MDDFHGKRLIRSERFKIWEIRFDENNTVITLIAPKLKKMNHIPESQRRVTTKNDTGLPGKINRITYLDS